jgi:RNA polymerase sigma-70 factor (ECF subfamily)
VNGQPGFTVTTPEGGIAVLTLDIADGQIQTIRAIANPDKLRALAPAPERPRAP